MLLTSSTGEGCDLVKDISVVDIEGECGGAIDGGGVVSGDDVFAR
jgi:hypothetical protein